MALFAPVTGRRAWLAAAIAGAMLLLLAPSAHAQVGQTELPASLETAVIEAAAAQASVPAADVEVLRVEAVTWANGCIGVTSTEACTQALVDGYVAWVLAGGAVHRFHTDETTNVQLGQTGILTSAVATAPLPGDATAREVNGGAAVIEGDIPASGVALFRVTTGASTADVRTSLTDAGCNATILAKTVGGEWYIYAFGSPAFANAGFFSADGSLVGGIKANTILLTSCGTAAQ